MPDTLAYRVAEVERRLREEVVPRIKDVEVEADQIPVLANEMTHLSRAVHELSEKAESLQRAVLTAALSFAVSAIVLALSIYKVFGP